MAPSADRPLHVGLNCFFLEERSGGTGTYVRRLVPALLGVEPGTRITAFVTGDAPEDLTGDDHGGQVRWERVPGAVAHGSPLRAPQSIASQWAIEPWRAQRLGLDVVHGLAGVAPLAGPAARVVTVLDLTWHHHPGAMTRVSSAGMRIMGGASARRADRVIAISHFGREDIAATWGIDPARIDVTLLGAPDDADGAVVPTPADRLRAEHDLAGRRVVLCIAQKRVHKNLGALIRALALLGREDVVLVLPGGHTPYEDELRALAAERGVADRVRFPGWVSDGDLAGLLEVADVFALPSLMEGFGLPILEAMRHGTPVACSDLTALPEVAGDAALLFDPHDDAAVAAALGRILDDPALAADLVARGHARCAELTWEATARATLASYRRALAARGRA